MVCRVGGGATSLCARSRGEPSSAHCEQRLSERLTPCPRSRVRLHRNTRGATLISASAPTRSAASRAGMAGWAGGGGADLASAGVGGPTLPSFYVSTARLATTSRHKRHAHQSQSEKQHAMPAKHGSPPPKQAHKPRRQPQNTPGQNENGCFRPALPVSASHRSRCAAGPAQPPQPTPISTVATSPRRRPSGHGARPLRPCTLATNAPAVPGLGVGDLPLADGHRGPGVGGPHHRAAQLQRPQTRDVQMRSSTTELPNRAEVAEVDQHGGRGVGAGKACASSSPNTVFVTGCWGLCAGPSKSGSPSAIPG